MEGTILVIEDDPAIRRGVVDALGFAGYRALEADDGASGLQAALSGGVELVLLDVLLPELDGFDVLAEIRAADRSLPVIMLTAKGSEEDRVRGLRAGADDYVVKPFSAKELLARVEAVMRRSAERPRTMGLARLTGRAIDFERRTVAFDDGADATELSEREATLLQYLVTRAGRVISRDELLSRVWGLDPRGVHTRTVDMHVARLRERLRDDGKAPRFIRTIRGKGYLVPEDEVTS